MKNLIVLFMFYYFFVYTYEIYALENKLKNKDNINLACFNEGILFLNAFNDNIEIVDTVENNSKAVHAEKLAGKIDTIKYNEHNSSLVKMKNVSAPKWYEMITNLPEDMVSFYHIDIRIEKIPIYTGIAVLTAGLIMTDEKTWKASDNFYNQSQIHKNISDLFVDFGDGSSQFSIAGAFAVYGLIAKDYRALRTASEVVEAVLASGAVVQLLKHITGRQSPYVSTMPGGEWRFFPNQIDYHKHVPSYDAFPSGHLTTTLAAFTVIAENYPEVKWIRPLAYSVSALLAVSMVNQGIHWYSDYPLAVFLGYEFGMIISQRSLKDNSSEKDIAQLFLLPFISNRRSGVQFSYSF